VPVICITKPSAAMGLFNLFKKRPPYDDPFFGALTHPFKKDTLFEGKKLFTPASIEVGLSIISDPTGPTQSHYNFYTTIEREYATLVNKIIPLIEDEFGNWQGDFKIGDFAQEFRLEHLVVPRQDVTPLKWDIAYTSIHDSNHWFITSFEGMTPMGILIDG